MPTMNGMRATPATVEPTPPAFPTVTSSAAITPTAAILSTVEPSAMAWNTPLFGSTVSLGSIVSTATVPTIYMSAINPPDAKIARGNVRCGFFTSSLIAETSSSPANANASCGQKFTVSQFQCGIIAATVKCVTDPWRDHSSSATPTIIISGTYVPTPPAFCSHLPICKPIMFRNTATNNITNEPTSKNVRFSASHAALEPPT